LRVYLDHNATTPPREEVVDAMERVLRETWGNPSSTHAEGAAARAAVDRAREQVASLVGCAPRDLLFTAGATEANNTALLGVLSGTPGHILSSAVEHPSVEAALDALESRGWEVTRAPVDPDGRVGAETAIDALREDTALVSLIWANNETGVLQPVDEIAEAARERGILFHTDATQRVGKLPIDLSHTPADLLSLSAHKLNGPKGTGALVVRQGLAFEPLLRGGPQEGGRRGGTENVAGIVGLGEACALAARELPERARRTGALRDRLWEGISQKIAGVRWNAASDAVLPNTLNVGFEGVAGEMLLQALDLEGISASAGAACASGSIEASPVLVAMGRSPAEARGTLRFSVGHGVDESQIDHVLALLPDLVERARVAGDV
jgi:cysteine desulfurase